MVGRGNKQRAQSSIDDEPRVNPLSSISRQKRSGFAQRHKGSKVYDELPRRYTFSYEVDETLQNSRSPSGPQLSFKPLTLSEDETAMNFGTAFEFTKDDSDYQKSDATKSNYKSIFTYEASFADVELNTIDDNSSKKAGGLFYGLVFLLCIILLVALFPIMAWICIKRLSNSERIIIFRLGKRLKPKGPGYVVVLPFADEYHLIDLDDQQIEIKPVSGGSADQAIVEIGCRVFFRIIDIEAVVNRAYKSYQDLLLRKAQSCLLAALARVDWADLSSGHALPDVACEVRASLNSYCGMHGIQIQSVTLGPLTTTKEPPPVHSILSRLNVSMIGQQLANLSPILLPDLGSDPAVSTNQQLSKFNELINQIASLKSTALSAEVGSEANEVQSVDQRTSLNQIVNTTISRANAFLSDELLCKSLGGTSLQVCIYETEVKVSDPLALFYIDSVSRRSDIGVLPGGHAASVTLHMTVIDFSDAILGRLNILEAVKQSRIRISGDIASLTKLKFLLQFR